MLQCFITSDQIFPDQSSLVITRTKKTIITKEDLLTSHTNIRRQSRKCFMIYKPSLLISNTDNTVLWQYFDKYQIIRYVLEKEEMRRRRRKRRRRLLENVLTCGDVS